MKNICFGPLLLYFTYHQVRTANPNGAVTVMVNVRQSVRRKAIPASSM